MDDHESADALTDAALERDLEAALAVDPSPEFVAGVRMRVQSELDAAPSPWRWRIMAAAACVAIIALVVGTSRQDRARVAREESTVRRPATVTSGGQDTRPGPVAQDSTAGQAFRPALTTAFRKSTGRRSRPRAAVGEPELLIAAGEARALRQLFSNARTAPIDLPSLQEAAPAIAALQPPSEIAFPPITFEPIGPAPAEEGDRQ